MIRILTDSTSDLSPELIARHKLEIIPLTVILKDKTYQDGREIQTSQLFDFVKQYNELPKTSAASMADFLAAFDHQIEILYIGISSKLSASFQNAVLAAREINGDGRIRLIDSLNLSTGIGMLALMAAELRDQGLSLAGITEIIESFVPKVRSSFVVDTLDYLYLGGRCSAVTRLAGGVLQIRPVIEVRPDGSLGVKDKIRGSREKALLSMVTSFERDLPQVDLQRVFITHTGCETDAALLEAEIRKRCQPEEICITTAGAVIASHCGPDTIGILYHLK